MSPGRTCRRPALTWTGCCGPPGPGGTPSRGSSHAADLRAVRQDPRVRRGSPPTRCCSASWTRCSGHYQLSAPVGICIGPGEKAQILHRDDAIYPVPAAAPAAGGQHHVAAGRVHRGQRGHPVHPRQPPVGAGPAAGPGRPGGDRRDVSPDRPCSTWAASGMAAARTDHRRAAARRDPGVRGRLAAATGEPLPGRAPRRWSASCRNGSRNCSATTS